MLERALGAHYDILQLLGRGGMGAVYLARERVLDRLVAIKILPPECAADAESRERFRREARTAAKLTHPNIVPLYAFGDVEGMLYFVMGYVRGESLADRLRREGRLRPEAARRILREVAEALAHAHHHGVVHRDIKPDNILLDEETGRPMLTDFGVAKARAGEGTLTATGMVIGTPLFMSPEQASAAPEIDGRSDLYSLGALGYTMLAGRPPFEGTGFQDLIIQHLSREPPPLEALAPEAPSDLVSAVTRCLAKAPELRWPDASSLAAAVGSEEVDEDDRQLRFPLSVLDQGLCGLLGVGAVCGVYIGGGLALAHAAVWGASLMEMALLFGCGGLAGGGLLYGGAAGIARRRGHTWLEIKTLFLRPPTWWRLWWPAVWRRRSDIWDRLPGILKRNRVLQTLAAGVAVPTVLTIAALFVGGLAQNALGVSQGTLDALLALLGVEAVSAVGLVATAMAQRERWGRSIGLTAREAAAAAERPTTDLAFWRKPKFAALLAPARAVRRAIPEPGSPQEYVAAIGDAARQLADPLRDVGRDVVEAARRLAGAIAALDTEIGQLARDASPADLAALERKIAALGELSGDSEPRRQMRTLLESQRDLLRSLARQLDAATARRTRLADLLKALWLQTAHLRALVAADAGADAELTGQIRALCGEVSVQASALDEVRSIAPQG